MAGTCVEFGGRRCLDQPARVHDVDPIRVTRDRAQIMRVIRTSATPRRWVSSLISSRICAWIVTSRAVVGSSAMISFGLQLSAIAIITRCRMPPLKLVRVLLHPALRLGDPDQAQEVGRALPGRSLRQPEVPTHAFDQLRSDGQHRVERGHRLLKDHGDVTAADVAQLVLAEAEQVDSLKTHRATRSGQAAVRGP